MLGNLFLSIPVTPFPPTIFVLQLKKIQTLLSFICGLMVVSFTTTEILTQLHSGNKTASNTLTGISSSPRPALILNSYSPVCWPLSHYCPPGYLLSTRRCFFLYSFYPLGTNSTRLHSPTSSNMVVSSTIFVLILYII